MKAENSLSRKNSMPNMHGVLQLLGWFRKAGVTRAWGTATADGF